MKPNKYHIVVLIVLSAILVVVPRGGATTPDKLPRELYPAIICEVILGPEDITITARKGFPFINQVTTTETVCGKSTKSTIYFSKILLNIATVIIPGLFILSLLRAKR